MFLSVLKHLRQPASIASALASGLMLATSLSLQAAEVRDCAVPEANAGNIDWTDPTRTFSNEAIRLIKLDTEEPACCSVHLMVLHPAGDDPFLACTLVSRTADAGWLNLSLAETGSRYVPGEGLKLDVPTQSYPIEGNEIIHGSITLVINQQTGEVLLK
jgi:hypothetical protein